MTAERRFLFVLHRSARQAGRRLAAAMRHAPGIARRSDVVSVPDAAEAADTIRGLDRCIIPVAAGGDGTVNLVVRALLQVEDAGRPIAVLPLGTGNAFAHEIGATSVRRGLRLLAEGRPVARDVMLTTHPAVPVALLSLSAGIESGVLRELERRRRWPLPLRGLYAVAAAVTEPRAEVTLQVDGRTLTGGEPLSNAGLYNTRHYGFGRVVFPEADPGDGIAEAFVCARMGDYVAALIGGVRPGGHRPGIQLVPWRTATLVAGQGIQFDGEPGPGGRFDVRVAERAVLVLGG